MPSLTPNFFSADYATARDRFRHAVAQAGGRLTPLALAARGPRGESLSIDIGWFGPERPTRAFVHSCGVHGVEAFAGSAIQLQWLTQGVSEMAPGCASVLVHVVNPYGMAWLRRVNERGVDLNRNCLGAGETYAGAPPGYDRLDQFLNPVPRRASTPYYLQAGWLIVRYGIPHLKQAIAGGQHVNPAGLFFGGRSLEQGPRELSRFVHERLAAVEYLIGIDVHTGLGPFGTDTLLVNADERSRSFTRLREAFGERVSLSDPRRSPAYRATGTYDTIFRRAAPGAGVDFVVQEFGTYSSLRVLKVLRAENLRHRQGDEGIDHPTKVDLRETFCPSDESWRMAVLTRGGAAIGQALGLLAGKKSD